jgi:hypothetical protein
VKDRGTWQDALQDLACEVELRKKAEARVAELESELAASIKSEARWITLMGGAKAERGEMRIERDALRAENAKLLAVARAAQSLLAEDDAREALAHYNRLHILAERLGELERV